MDVTEIRNRRQLRKALGGESTSSGVNTIRHRLAPIDEEWLAGCPLWWIGTTNGRICGVSPRGDEPGAVLVLDAKTIVWGELPGNNRGDAYHDWLSRGFLLRRNRQIGITFVIPGRLDTLRIGGRARMVTDAPWFDRLALNGKRPPLAIVVDVKIVFYHCVKALRRAGAWNPDRWPNIAPPRRQVSSALSLVLGTPIACEDV